jgi:hypothetical protein
VGPDDTNVYFVNTIDAISVGWAFGFSLNSSATVLPSQVPTSEPVSSLTGTGAKAGVGISVVLAAMSAVALVVSCRKRRELNEYTPISPISGNPLSDYE